MRTTVLAALVGLFVLSATVGGASAQGPLPNPAPIFPPLSSIVRPQRVYVLPVVWIPSQNAGTATSPYVTKARTNLGIHLRTAREKYRSMLKNPLTGAHRGTFEIATWDAAANRARPYAELANTLQPLVVQSTSSYWSMADTDILGEVLTAAGCKVQTCPFVFVILVHHDADLGRGIYGVPFNYGFNGGGGFVRIPIDIAHDAATMNIASPATRLMSTVLHELGHAFGLLHLADVYKPVGVSHLVPDACRDLPGVKESGTNNAANDPYDTTSSCPLSAFDAYCDVMPWSQERLEFHCSPSVMSYSKRNQTRGCLATDGAGTCTMPTAAQIATLPGILISENLNNLARNRLVFPDLAADFDLQIDDDDGNGSALSHPGFSYPDNPDNMIPGHPQLTVSSSVSEEGTEGRMSFGQHWRQIAPLGAAYNDWRMWRSIEVGAGAWASFDFTFPENVQLSRVRVYTGSDGGIDQATDVEMRYGAAGSTFTNLCASATLGGAADGEVQGYSWCTAARLHRVRLKAGSSGRVVVRMIRLFDWSGNEIQSPGEPFASSAHTHPSSYATQPGNVVGGEQVILGYASGFSYDRMWHSKQVATAGEWVAFDVRLPEKLALTSVAVYTGHSGYYHRADRAQVWIRDENNTYVSRGDSFATSAPQATVPLPGIEGRHLRIWLRTTTSPATKHVVIRGIRFFTAEGEAFVPRAGYSGIAPVL